MTRQIVRREISDIHLPTGVTLRYVECGDPQAPAVILLHGITDSSFSFSRIQEGLARNYRVFALDQRGHGDSSRPETGYTPADFAADLIAFMDAMGLEKASVAGHAMGSFIAQRLGLDAPERLVSLVLISSAESCDNAIVQEAAKEMAALPDPVPEDYARAFQESTVFAPLPEGFMDRIVSECRKAPARVWAAAMRGLRDASMSERLSEIKTPALVIWGEKDAIFSRAEQDGLMARLPNARFIVYENVGHAPHWERTDLVLRDIEDFLSKTW